MMKLLYGIGMSFKGLAEMWDDIANYILLGFNEVDPKEIFYTEEMFGEEFGQPEDESDEE